ncbi:DUF3427 domain-containing protein [Pseudomonas neustonica]|uniref:DUF3427 domain-containing protein n=2 Tax=Pseudomonas TaxID=286 RepID=A0ABX9XL62_9PSED|nr:DUF3427 domain-containing protein [Pseudomonas sp. 5Ae-yellow]ROZ85558.1 DUF3427 domain-containing protein [Pseudomonas sp. SSM44]ROZ87548.1 DUF3427 domain-containing protein [Pseudomonas neustonica]
MSDHLLPGLYDALITTDIQEKLVDSPLYQQTEPLAPEWSHERLAELLTELLSRTLAETRVTENNKSLAQAELINELVRFLQLRAMHLGLPEVALPPSLLKAVSPVAAMPDLPSIGLAQPWLFTAGRDSPPLLHELQAELACCDQVDILVSFITVSGVRKIIDTLKRITSADAQGRSQTTLRVLTTTYTGATEQKALDMLAQLPNTEVRISLDGRRTRLHAKAWIFQRETGFGSAYVGSANLSGAALMGGLEWTVKFTEKGQNNLFHRAQAHFETLWEDGEFQHYNPDDPQHRQLLKASLKREDSHGFGPAVTTFLEVTPKPFQQEILEQLESERAMGRWRNLLVAATGTGKTVMAAFDYRANCRSVGGRPRLLFVAHRSELLRQARHVYRQVLNDANFGELLDGNHEPDNHSHLFASITTVNNRDLIATLGPDYWHTVVIDECHHIAAASFLKLISAIQPKILLGLTATPERADGQNILHHFNNRPDGSPAAELRLWRALDLQLLCPFEYYACDDETDLSSVPWQRAEETAALGMLISHNVQRAKSVVKAWNELVTDPRDCRTLVFCVNVAHAEFMSQLFNELGIISKVITAGTSQQERAQIPKDLEAGSIHAIVTVDIFNEGVDLPFVDTLLLLRPTQSATVFQQQLGRGLRLHDRKKSCLVLDFVGQHAEHYRFDLLYSSITGLNKRELLEGVEKGFARLPSGCHMQLQKQAREQILRSLRNTLNQNWKKLQRELSGYAQLNSGRPPNLADFLKDQHLDINDIYRDTSSGNTGWTNLKRAAGLLTEPVDDEENYFSRRFSSLLHVNDVQQLTLLHKVGEKRGRYSLNTPQEHLRAQMLAYQIDGQHMQTGTGAEFLDRLQKTPTVCQELVELSEYLLAHVDRQTKPLRQMEHTPLQLHGAYQIREILTAVGFLTGAQRAPFQAGVLALKDINTELLFVTLDKSNALHEGVAYHDYAISNDLFHWQSQNSAGPMTKTGQRYLQSPDNGWRFQLFVRTNKQSPYIACGPAVLEKSHGNKPMSITWRLQEPLPAAMFKEFSVLVG